MTAKEMFEKLGYDIYMINGHFLSYTKKLNNKEKTITFLDSGVSKYFVILEDDRINPTITLEELQAINKQVEELEWNK
jgi:hypothetical protein